MTVDSRPAIALDDVHYAYPGDEPIALAGVSLHVRSGERVALLGANGAGKSTLLLHLNGLLTPRRGSVTVDGLPVDDAHARDVRRRVGLVFQEPDDQLFLPSLLEDVAFGPLNDGASTERAVDMARQQLRALGLEHAADRAAHHLSGGEKRLASLATVLVSHPLILALDEPTAGLDARARRHVVDLLRDRTETLIVATHDLQVARALCRRAVVLAAGRVAADGSIGRVLDDTDLLHANGLIDPLDALDH